MATTDDYLEFFKKTQKLKNTLRHSWTEDVNRQESTAEHTWQMSLMAIAFAPKLKFSVNMEKVLKMISIHDLGEALTGDIPAFDKTHPDKHKAELEAYKEISKTLPVDSCEELLALYKEYKDRKTKEAIFVKMLDVIDVIFQHLVADISTWSKVEMTFNLNRNSAIYFTDEPFMRKMYDEIHNRLGKKVDKEQKRLGR